MKNVKVTVSIIDKNHNEIDTYNIYFFSKNNTWFQLWENFRSLKRHVRFLLNTKC